MTSECLRLSVLLIGVLAVFGVACGSNDDTNSRSTAPSPAVTGAVAAPTATPLRGDLTVFAAASLTDAFNEIGKEFQTANPGITPKFNYAASTALRTQLEQGAKADVYASADQIQMDNAKKAGVVDGEDRLFVKNKLVVIYPANNPANVQSIQDLARPNLKFVLTDRNVPIGAYARTALEKLSADPQYGAGFGQKVLNNLRSEEANVRAVVTKVQLGEADAAIVYASDVTSQVSAQVKSILIPDQFNTIATYPIAMVRDAPNRAAAQAFISFVRSASGQAILKKHNFIVDQETGKARTLTPSAADLLALARADHGP